MRAGQHFDSPEDHDHDCDADSTTNDNTQGDKDQKEGAEKTTPASVSSKDTGLEYQYGDAFYMAEINLSGNVFAVEERPGKSTLARLYSPSGKLLSTSELHVHTAVAADTKESSKAGEDGNKSGVKTLFISTYKDGHYALAVQGGYVLSIDAENLTITSSFKVVRKFKETRTKLYENLWYTYMYIP